MPNSPSRATRHLPLAGRRVLVTRPAEQAREFVQGLRNLGAEPILCPMIRIVPPDSFAPLDAAIAGLRAYDWVIFTSVNGVRSFFERLEVVDPKGGLPGHLRFGTIGPATARALAGHSVTVDFVPSEYVAESIVEGIGDVRGLRILLPRADIARKTLVEGLAAKGAEVREVTAYRTVPAGGGDLQAWLDQGSAVDVATFTSPSTVHHFAALLEDRPAREVLGRALVACIGPITARAAQSAGLAVHIVAPEHTLDGLLQAIVEYIEEQN